MYASELTHPTHLNSHTLHICETCVFFSHSTHLHNMCLLYPTHLHFSRRYSSNLVIKCMCVHSHNLHMGWLQLVGSMKLYISFAKEPYKRDNILQKRSVISSILLTAATPYAYKMCVFFPHPTCLQNMYILAPYTHLCFSRRYSSDLTVRCMYVHSHTLHTPVTCIHILIWWSGLTH